MRLPDSLRRALRTFLQGFVGTFLALNTGLGGQVPSLGGLKAAATAALWAGVIAVLSWAQNALEDSTPVPALLKAPPSSGENPVPGGG